MAGITLDRFFDLTPNSDTFQLTANLLEAALGGLRGLEGEDQITGSSTSELMNGNQDPDQIFGGGGNDTLLGGKDGDFLFGDEGNDRLNGNLGNDQLTGNEGDDFLSGGKDDDFLTGLEGNDTLSGDLGQDTLRGGAGFDRFMLSVDANIIEINQADIIEDFELNQDQIQLPPELTFNQIELQEISGITSNNIVIKVKDSPEILGIVVGVSAIEVTSNQFV